jgi:uncharacterized protein (UPF0261 family)
LALLWTRISALTNIYKIFKEQPFYHHLPNIAKILTFLSNFDAEKLIHDFVTSRLDYCNALLFGYMDKALNKLQLVLNTAA